VVTESLADFVERMGVMGGEVMVSRVKRRSSATGRSVTPARPPADASTDGEVATSL